MLLNLRLKFHADGSYDKCKARAVIMGNGMCYPRDHGLTHASTARETAVRTKMCRALHNISKLGGFWRGISAHICQIRAK
jgi:hypothetical protein